MPSSTFPGKSLGSCSRRFVWTYFRFGRHAEIIFSEKIISMLASPRHVWILGVALIRARLQDALHLREWCGRHSSLIHEMQPLWTSFAGPLWLSRLQDDVVCPCPLRCTLHVTLYAHQDVGARNQLADQTSRFHCGAMQLVRGFKASRRKDLHRVFDLSAPSEKRGRIAISSLTGLSFDI